jgi:putative photosynthetic complex assembly protein 2
LDAILAIAVVLFAWWISTGIILYLVGMPKLTFRFSMGVVTLAMLMAMFGLWVVKDDASVGGAYAGFVCGLIVWGWNEMGFLTGFITGPRKTDCPKDARGWARFSAATQTVLYHELAILASVSVAAVLTWDGANQIGLLTLMVLWIARISAKLNVYLGVENLTEEFLPSHLEHLKSYFRRQPMNLLLPVSVTVATVATAALVGLAIDPEATAFETVGYTLLATLMGLVVVEHWFLVLPIPAASMWSWGMASRTEDGHAVADTKPFADSEQRLDVCARTATGL